MAVYLVTPLNQNHAQLGVAISAKVASEDFHELQGQAGWLVSFGGTSVDLSNLIGITKPVVGKPDAGIGSAMVTSVGTYYGLASTTMWEWLKVKFEKR